MKIIGRGERDKLLCEITLKELNTILSRDDSFSMIHNVEVGENIDLAGLIEAAKWIKGLDSNHLLEVIKGVEKVRASVEKLNLLNTLSTEVKPKGPFAPDENDDDIPF